MEFSAREYYFQMERAELRLAILNGNTEKVHELLATVRNFDASQRLYDELLDSVSFVAKNVEEAYELLDKYIVDPNLKIVFKKFYAIRFDHSYTSSQMTEAIDELMEIAPPWVQDNLKILYIQNALRINDTERIKKGLNMMESTPIGETAAEARQ